MLQVRQVSRTGQSHRQADCSWARQVSRAQQSVGITKLTNNSLHPEALAHKAKLSQTAVGKGPNILANTILVQNRTQNEIRFCRPNQDNMSLIETYYLHAREPTQGRLSSTRQVSRLRQSRNTIGNFACGVPQDIPETAILPKEWLTAPLKIPGKQPFFGF